jgi:hypothetical protein
VLSGVEKSPSTSSSASACRPQPDSIKAELISTSEIDSVSLRFSDMAYLLTTCATR